MQDNSDLLKKSYNYYLPSELIASRPVSPRDHARLLVYDAKKDKVTHSYFYDLPRFMPKDSLLVLNESKVYPSRFFGEKKTGGKAELLLLTINPVSDLYECMIRARGKKEIGDEFYFGELKIKIERASEDGTFFIKINLTHEKLLELIHEKGNIPIPPYIRDGISDEQDRVDYQTIYAKDEGSVAAPTAGLHFTEDLFLKLSESGIKKDFVTLHVGAGTFKPVTEDNILDHKMHKEFYSITNKTLKNLNNYKNNIIAVGTTSLRTLESSFEDGHFSHLNGDTEIFLYPGVSVKSIAGLITNFHLPESTLLMLVASLIGREKTLALYEIAVREKYRFYSYGDGMLILR